MIAWIWLLSILSLASATLAKGAKDKGPKSTSWQPDFILRVSQQNIAPACQPRWSTVVNGTSPGPLLRMTEGQHVWVRVYNDIPDQNTTIHFHGFTQFATPFSDGTPLGSQWPIPPGRYFDYEFKLDEGFYGTYWYHSHVGMQSITAKGPIIVDPKPKNLSPVQYDEELVMMMSDYYNADDSKMVAGLMNETKFAWVGEANAITVNGHAQGVCNSTILKSGQDCGAVCGLSKQVIKPGKKYRVRVIAASVLSHISMALEGHTMTLFEADGTYLNPIQIESLEIAPGQRYSVLIEAKNTPNKTDYYWRMKTIWRPVSIAGSAVWSYDRKAKPCIYDPTVDNHSISTNSTPVDLAQRVFLPNATFGWRNDDFSEWKQNSTPPQNVTRTIFLDGQQVKQYTGGLGWAVSGHVTYESTPQVPYLIDYYSKPEDQRKPNYAAALANGGLDLSTESYPARKGEVLDLVLQNKGGPTGVVESHPWHLHGAKYWDMGGGTGNFSYDALTNSLATRKGKPFRRDTSVVYAGPGASYIANQTIGTGTPGGWRLFRIEVTDPGLWVMHCHIIPHQVMGMLVNFLFAAEDLPPIPSVYMQDYAYFGTGAYKPNNETYQPRSYFAEIGR